MGHLGGSGELRLELPGVIQAFLADHFLACLAVVTSRDLDDTPAVRHADSLGSDVAAHVGGQCLRFFRQAAEVALTVDDKHEALR